MTLTRHIDQDSTLVIPTMSYHHAWLYTQLDLLSYSPVWNVHMYTCNTHKMLHCEHWIKVCVCCVTVVQAARACETLGGGGGQQWEILCQTGARSCPSDKSESVSDFLSVCTCSSCVVQLFRIMRAASCHGNRGRRSLSSRWNDSRGNMTPL